ncbi:tonB-linked outer membrane protein SusC/RagA family [Parabacteroides sp. CAG:409]|nr:tonB-linked outer membrane protein SusC/RagA family [Parabacteroides sp. CAG:409]
MKLTCALLLTASMGVFATGNAQTMRVNIQADNVSTGKILSEIEKQTDYLFVYNKKEVDLKRKTSVNAVNKTTAEVLSTIFEGTDIIYAIEGENIMLMRKEQNLAVVPDAVQQDNKITGTVLDPTGMPVIGANIMIKGTTNGTITDMDGKFSLDVPKGAILVVTYVGYANQELQVGSQKTLSITLKEDSEALDELVVVGYSTQKKVNLTGSVSTVSFNDKLTSRPVTDVSQMLNGASPGLQIMQSSGEPNAESFSYNIRGVGTLNSSSPLILVDGMEQSISMVNPSDIASVSILKDAASCAIYGNRGANGVILITTKSGSDGKISISYDGTVSYNEPFKIIHTISDYVSYMKLMNESANNLGNSDIFSQSSIDLWEAANADPNGTSASGYPNYVAYPNTDWWNEIYTKQWMQKHSISLNGKEKRTGYSMSFSYIDNPGVVKKTGYQRYMGRINLYSDITDWLRVGTRTWGNVTDRDVSSSGSGFFNSINTMKMTPCIYPYYDGKYGAPEGPEDDPQSHNPLWDMAVSDGHDKYTQLYTDWYAQVKFLKYFTYNFDFYYKDLRRKRKLWILL